MAFSPDGKRIVSAAADDKTVKVWDADTGQETLSLKGHTDRVNSVAFSPDGKRIVTGSRDKTVKVWDADKGQEVLTLKGHTGSVSSVAFSPDGKRIVSGSGDKTVKVWDAGHGQESSPSRDTQLGHQRGVQPRRQTHRQRQRGQDGEGVGRRDGQEVLSLKGHTHGVISVAFSPDGKRIVTAARTRR